MPGFIETKQARRRTQNPLTGGRRRIGRGRFAACVMTNVDSYVSQYEMLWRQWIDEYETRIRTEYKRLSRGKRSADEKNVAAMWQEAWLRVNGSDDTLSNQIYSATELYCVAIYRVLERCLKEFSKIRGVGDVATLAKLTKRYPQIKPATASKRVYRRVLELSLIYRVWLDGSASIAIRRLKKIRPPGLSFRDFFQSADAVKIFAKAVQRAFRNRAP